MLSLVHLGEHDPLCDGFIVHFVFSIWKVWIIFDHFCMGDPRGWLSHEDVLVVGLEVVVLLAIHVGRMLNL